MLLISPATYNNVGNGVNIGFHMVCCHLLGIMENRNKACFEKHLIKDPLEIICHACALVKYWAGLFPSIDKEKLEEGAATMLRLAKELLASQRKNREEGRRLDSRDQNEDDDEPV